MRFMDIIIVPSLYAKGALTEVTSSPASTNDINNMLDYGSNHTSTIVPVETPLQDVTFTASSNIPLSVNCIYAGKIETFSDELTFEVNGSKPDLSYWDWDIHGNFIHLYDSVAPSNTITVVQKPIMPTALEYTLEHKYTDFIMGNAFTLPVHSQGFATKYYYKDIDFANRLNTSPTIELSYKYESIADDTMRLLLEALYNVNQPIIIATVDNTLYNVREYNKVIIMANTIKVTRDKYERYSFSFNAFKIN